MAITDGGTQVRAAGAAARSIARRVPVPMRVWLFSGLLALVAASVYLLMLGHRVAPMGDIEAPWPLVAAAFLAAELKVIDVHFRREKHSFSLSELAGVIGLFLLDPGDYLLAAASGTAVALLFAGRQQTIKLAFNVANAVAVGALTLVVFHAILPSAGFATSGTWLATFAATSVAAILSAVSIATVISLSGGAPQFQKLFEMIQFGGLVALANTSLGLLAVTVLRLDPTLLWLLVVPLVVVFLAYRAYLSEREKHERLELLYESSRILQHSSELDSAIIGLLDHARRMFRAERAEVLLYQDARTGEALLTRSVLDQPPLVMAPIGLLADDPIQRRLAQRPSAFLHVPKSPAHADGIRQAMVAPLRGESGTIGSLLVANRLTEGTTFAEDDLRLLETLANQAAVALENGQLEQSLAELSRLKEELRYQAYHDPLTGLGNRSLFVEEVDGRLGRGGAGLLTVVLFLDLDDFKVVNDTLGHGAGDRMLVAVADRLRRCVRSEDVAARLGGDEFAILIGDEPDLKRSMAVAGRIIDELKASFLVEGQELTVTASIGIAAALPGEGVRSDELLRNADVAMYTAKANGKSRIAVFDPTMHAAIVARHAMSSELGKSIGRGELAVHYQPIIELATGSMVGLEALVRWHHPTRGVVGPEEFIPLAEESGVILELGRWVLDRACTDAASWQRTRPGGMFITVNLSAAQLQQPTFVEDIEAVLARSGLPPSRLALELTETAMFHDTQTTIARLQSLRELGVRIAIDDFGTGYSSLGYLRRFQVDILKIAREFVARASDPEDEWAFAHSIIALGRTLGLSIVAEGIEEAGQAGRLADLGCELGQGYYFARPMDRAAVDEALGLDAGTAAQVPERIPTGFDVVTHAP